MLNLLEERLHDPTAGDLCYVLALLMVRRKILRLASTEQAPHAEDVLVLFSPKTEQEYRVPVVEPTRERVAEIQALLSGLKVVESRNSA
jgi:hypothetical protein